MELDFEDGGPASLSFSRIYRSNWGSDSAHFVGILGKAWNHNHSTYLQIISTDAATNAIKVAIHDPAGYTRTFSSQVGTQSWAALGSSDSLEKNNDGWIYLRAADDQKLTFNKAGKLLVATSRNGLTTTYTYDIANGRLNSIRGAFGRTLWLGYNTAGQLLTVTGPDARRIDYAYDTTGRLKSITYPDGKARTLLYEDTTFSHALTGILDESGVRWATFAYDSQGRAISSELAGATDHYGVGYPSTGSATVTDPLGTSRTYGYGSNAGKLTVTGGTLPSGTGEADAGSRVQDANGLITSETDFNGVVTTTSWDMARRLPLSVTRGSGTPEAVTTTTQWHSTFSLPVLIADPGRTTSFSYDAVGNLLSKTVADTGSGGTTRTWSWTYNAQQLVATATEPNGAVTNYTYDTFGNVLTASNALGHVTTYTYDTANRVASMTAPNGLVTAYTYDLRDRLLTQTVGGTQTTTFTYNPTGTLATLTIPSGLVITYAYDAAHRLTGWSNNRGESGTFTLDGMGNRTAEQIKDSSGAVAFMVARSINNINRVSSATEGSGQIKTFGYDANGDLTSQTNALSQSTRWGLDNLRRVKTVTNAANATASLTRNGLDDVTQATDFKGVATSYGRDALGNATSEASNDSGARSAQYDALGLPSQIVDALGQATQIQRDALGRPTSLTFADGKSTLLTYDLASTGSGYLSQVVDRSGTTTYTRDAFGRVTLKQQALIGGQTQQVAYGYTASGQLGSITYPSGSVLSHIYDATGRLTRLDWNGAPLVSAITWNPMGQPTGWSWALVTPSLAASRTYDTAGRLTATEFSSYVYNAAGRITSLTQQLFYPGDSDPNHNTIALGSTTWNVSYDAVGRITGFDVSGGGQSSNATASFGYDANGNRTTSSQVRAGQTINRSYTIDGTGNRLLGFAQTGSTNTSVTYGYNANGDLTSDGLRSFAYNAEARLSGATTGSTDTSPTTRYAYNALGQRVFKTEPLYPPIDGDAGDPGIWESLMAFFSKLWAEPLPDNEKLGFGYVYDEEGTLLAETGTGGGQSSGRAQYIWLPTASGPLPVAVIVNGSQFYAIQADHLNTPRRLVDAGGYAVWQWAYSAFGDEKPTLARYRFADLDVTPNPDTTGAAEVKFNLRYPGQYFDEESGLHYNYFRSYSPASGRYTQPDPIGLDGGWNRFAYVESNALSYVDPSGLDNPGMGAYGPPWRGVQRCARPINISWVGKANALLPNHNWIRTGSTEAGMGARCPVPGQGCSDTPGVQTQTIDHSGQGEQADSQCEYVPNVNEQCVNNAIRPGVPTGRWMPWNQCQTFASDVLDRCALTR